MTGQLPFGVVIPARHEATRLPGKPLREIEGKPMILHVLQLAQRSGAQFVWVATDSESIADVVQKAGGDAVMTSKDHRSGSDRIAEALRLRGVDPQTIVVNVQGDEPLLPPALIPLVATNLEAASDCGIATLATPIRDRETINNPNVVKVVRSRSNHGLYFSRASIPYERASVERPKGCEALRHIGLYAYRAETLWTLAAHGPVALEVAESLEQLRALWLGISIHVDLIADAPAHGVDTEEDLVRVSEMMRSRD